MTESDITHLVNHFYARVRVDAVLGPVFARKIPNETAAWDRHIAHIADFWSSIFLKTGRYKGNPMLKHAVIGGLTPEHFSHWLDLFKTSAQQTLSDRDAGAVLEMAERIAKSLQMGLAFNAEKAGDFHHPFQDYAMRPSKLGGGTHT